MHWKVKDGDTVPLLKGSHLVTEIAAINTLATVVSPPLGDKTQRTSTLSTICCVTLSNLLTLSDPQFSHL